MFTMLRVVLLATFLSMTLGAGILGAAENGQAAPDVGALQAEIARLKAEVAVLQAKLDEAQNINAELVKKMAAQPGGGKPNPVAVPRDGTEVSLSQILADGENYWQAQTAVTVIGGAYIEDDASGVGEAVTFHLRELRPDKKAGRLSVIVIVPTAISKPLVDGIGDATTRGLDGKVVRLKASLIKGGDKFLLHAKDYQMLDPTSNTWGPWQSETVKAPKPAAGENRKPATIAELVGAAQRWLAAPKQETEAAGHERRDKIVSDLIGRRVELRGVLENVRKDPKGTVSVDILYVSSRQVEQTVSTGAGGFSPGVTSKKNVPAETIRLHIAQTDSAATTMKKGVHVLAQAVIERIVFGRGGQSGVADWITSGRSPPQGAVHVFVTATDGSVGQ